MFILFYCWLTVSSSDKSVRRILNLVELIEFVEMELFVLEAVDFVRSSGFDSYGFCLMIFILCLTRV